MDSNRYHVTYLLDNTSRMQDANSEKDAVRRSMYWLCKQQCEPKEVVVSMVGKGMYANHYHASVKQKGEWGDRTAEFLVCRGVPLLDPNAGRAV